MLTLRALFENDAPAAAHAAPSRARDVARRNWRRNAAAVARAQGWLLDDLAGVACAAAWAFGRDGSLTARTAGGRWWGGCSLPARAGREMLKELDADGPVAMFLAPTTAGQLRAALEKLQPTQAVVAVVPDARALRVMLHCDDFAAEVDAGRLRFVTGWRWDRQLDRLLAENPGLPLPKHFVRTQQLDENRLNAMATAARAVFTARAQSRADHLRAVHRRPRARRTNRICIVAPGAFRPWDYAGLALASALGADERGADAPPWVWIDPDRPTQAGPLALAEAAAGTDAVVFADTGRTDLPGVVAEGTPWITWVTTGRIPSPDPANPGDGLLLADPSWRPAALAGGWPVDRIDVAGWPALVPDVNIPDTAKSTDGVAGPVLGLIGDATIPDVPKAVEEFSSHRLLWELIATELPRDPAALGRDPAAYLASRMKRLAVAGDALDRPLFLRALVGPAYLRGVARLLIRQGLPLALYGRGWDGLEDLASFHAGTIDTFDDLTFAASRCAALVAPEPLSGAHAIHALNRPVFDLSVVRGSEWIRIARTMSSSRTIGAPFSAPLSRGRVLSMIPGFRFDERVGLTRDAD